MQEQNTMLPATARTWTAWYGVECTYHGHGLLQIQLGQDKSFFHHNASLYSEEYLNEEMRTLLEAGGEGGGGLQWHISYSQWEAITPRWFIMVQKMKYQDLLCSSRKYFHTLPNKRDFFQDPTPFQILLELLYHKFHQIFRSKKTLQPQKIPLFSVGGVWIFSRTAHYFKKFMRACLPKKPMAYLYQFLQIS